MCKHFHLTTRLVILTFLTTALLEFTVPAYAGFPNIDTDVETEFGTYQPYLSNITPNSHQYTIAADLANVTNTAQFQLSDEQMNLLAQKGFIAMPSGFEQIRDMYKYLKKQGIPIFVTTDSVLHAYHILYDYTLRILEFDRFVKDLGNLTNTMLNSTIEQYHSATDELARIAAKKNIAYFTVAAKLMELDIEVEPDVAQLVESELNLIKAHSGIQASPIFGYAEDYSQYIPRGHYTRNETFERFFKAMMWYGRMMFRLAPSPDDDGVKKGKEEILQALLIVAIMESAKVDGELLLTVWDRIYQPTVFFVGKADDLTVYQYIEIAHQVYGDNFATLSADVISDVEKLSAFIDTAKSLPVPQINSAIVFETEDFQATTQGFRFMGQRFIPDSYILNQLSHKRVNGRFFPRGLDVFAVLGSQRAYQILMEIYREGERYPDYSKQLEKVKSEFVETEESDWVQNLYWAWLYALMPLLTEKAEGYPVFMQSVSWQDKELTTALGSWTELRHDTILYAKQSYAELTAMPIQPPKERGYVEPNPELYARLASLARLMLDGLNNRELLLPEFASKLTALEDLLISLKEISESELTNQPLTDEQYDLILNIGGLLEYLVTFSSAVSGKIENEEDKKMAIVADVHTDANSGQVLEEGVGRPMELYVIVPVDGALKICQGAMFSYYEFTHPMSDRLTDGKWQNMLDTNPPPLPTWTNSFIVTTLPIEPSQEDSYDVNRDGFVDIFDLVSVAIHFGQTVSSESSDDVNGDGQIDILDLVFIVKHFGE